MHMSRPEFKGTRHVVSAGHHLASAAAFNILEAGGNAIDAGVAGGIALGVLQSDLVSVAGVAPIILYLAETEEIVTISGLGWWPKAADTDYFRREHGGAIPHGLKRTVVPAAPDAWITALEKYGTMSFGDCAEAAIRFAGEGFAMFPLKAQTITNNVEIYRRYPSSAQIYLPDGEPPQVGSLFRNPDLADSLRYMVDEERAAARVGGREAGLKAARDAFYKGDIARRIVRFQEEEGGWLTAEDLASFRVGIEPPVKTTFGDVEVYGCGVWCQGPALLQALNLVESFDLKGMGYNSPDYIHTLTEAIKLVMADRDAWYGDPRFVDVPIDRLLSKEYADIRREMIRPHEAWPEMPAAGKGVELGVEGDRPAPKRPPKDMGSPGAELDTSYLCVVDRHGNVFSATPSDGSYNGPITPGTGMAISPRGSQSWTDPDHPSCLAPGKRPRLTPNPAIAIRGNREFVPFGTPGGDVQTQAMLQTFLNVFVWGMEPQAAVEAPRFASYSFPSSFEPHKYYPGLLKLEGLIDRAAGDELERRGHRIEWWPDVIWLAGSMGIIHADRETGLLSAGADPRRMAYAMGW